MNTHTHTQGPWRIETWIYQNARESVTIQTDKDAIATACNLWRDGDDSTFEVMANARLIAAAPDLLEALQSLTHPMASDQDLQNALAVIAKVKGGDA
jgi:hypothetical protein